MYSESNISEIIGMLLKDFDLLNEDTEAVVSACRD